jgi:hypothetical protein
MLENRLHNSQRKSAEVKNQNKNLKTKIDFLRMEILTRRKLNERLRKKLVEVHKNVQSAMQKSDALLNEKDTWQQIQDSVLNQADLTKDKLQKSMEDYNAIINFERESAQEFLKGDKHQKEPISMVPVEYQKEGDMSVSQEDQFEHRLDAYNKIIKEETEKATETERQIKMYGQCFEKLKELSGPQKQKLEEVVDKFITEEEYIFSMYQYIQEVNNETEQEQEAIQVVQKEMKDYVNSMEQGASSQMGKKVEGLHITEEQTKHNISHYTREKNDVSDQVSMLSRAVHRLYTVLGCGDDINQGSNDPNNISRSSQSPSKNGHRASLSSIASMSDLMSANGVTDSNILVFLGIIEERAHEVLSDFNQQLQTTQMVKAASVASMTTNASHLSLSASATPITAFCSIGSPKNFEDSMALSHSITWLPGDNKLTDDEIFHDDEEGDEVPLTAEQIKELAVSTVEKKKLFLEYSAAKTAPLRSSMPSINFSFSGRD